MPITAEELRILVRAETDKAKRDLDRFRKTSKNTTLDLKQLAKSLIGPLSVTAGLVALGAVAKRAIVGSIKYAASVEQISVSFEVLLGSAAAAKDVLEELRQFSVKTPFTFAELAPAAKRLLAFGTEAENVVSVMRDLGNAAAGNGETLERLVDAYGKVQAKGRASLEELNRFTEAGVPLMRQLAEDLGLTNEELFKFVSQGKVGFEEVDRALQNLTRGEGQFAGMLERQSETLAGVFSTLQGAVQDLGLAFAKDFLPFLTGAVKKMTEIVTIIGARRQAATVFKEVFDPLIVDGATAADKLAQVTERLQLMKLAEEELNRVLAKRDEAGFDRRETESFFTSVRSAKNLTDKLWDLSAAEDVLVRQQRALEKEVAATAGSMTELAVAAAPVIEDEKAQIDFLKILNDEFAKTLESQKAVVEGQIAMFESFIVAPKSIASLINLREQLFDINEALFERAGRRDTGLGFLNMEPGDFQTQITGFGAVNLAVSDLDLAFARAATSFAEFIETPGKAKGGLANVFAFPFEEGGGEQIGTRTSAMAAFFAAQVEGAAELVPRIKASTDAYRLFGEISNASLSEIRAQMDKLASEDAQKVILSMEAIGESLKESLVSGAFRETLSALSDIGQSFTDVTAGAKSAADAVRDWAIAMIASTSQALLTAGLQAVILNPADVRGWALIAASGLLSIIGGLAKGQAASNAAANAEKIPDASQLKNATRSFGGDTVTIIQGDVITQDKFSAKVLATTAAAMGNR